MLRSLWEKMTSSPDPEVMRKLATVELFGHLDESSLRQIARLSVQRSFTAGSLVLREGSVGLGMLVITRGRVEVFADEDHRRLPIAELGSGAVVGEMALIDQQPRSASAVALEPTEVLLLTREGFRRLVERHPRIAWSLVPTLVDRLRDLQARLVRAEGVDPRAAVAVADHQQPEPPPSLLPPVQLSVPPPPISPPTSGRPAQPGLGSFLRLPAAVVASGMAGVSGSLAAFRQVAQTLNDELELNSDSQPSDLARSLPQGLARAGREALDQGRRVPRRVLSSFLDDLRGNSR